MPSETEQALQIALDAYRRGEYTSIRACATSHGVDKSTLSRRLKGGITRQQAREEQQTLSPIQEDLLKRWILDLDLAGAPPSFAQVREFAGLISQASGGHSSVGVNWIQRFLKRHPEVQSKVGKPIEYLRAENASPEALQTFFDLFLRVMTKFNISSANTWNFDEHGLGMGVCTNQRVLGQSATRRSYIKTPANRDWVTIIEACSAEGYSIDPLILFKGKDLQSTWFPENTPSNWHFQCTDNAFTTNQIGLDWLRKIFLPQTANNNDIRLLLCDNHNSHITVAFMFECYSHNIQLLFMPPHSSHILQPLDVGVFSTLKHSYRKEITNLSRCIETAPVQRAQFIKYYSKARSEVLIPYYIKAGWSGTGLYPYNPTKVLSSSQVIHKANLLKITPQTPSSNKRKQPYNNVNITPRSGRQLQAQARNLFDAIPPHRDARILLRKAAKAIDQLTLQSINQSLQINQLSVTLEAKNSTKRAKVTIDSNNTFASILDIKKAQDRAIARTNDWNKIDRDRQAQLVSQALQNTQFTSLCHEWHVNDTNGVDI